MTVGDWIAHRLPAPPGPPVLALGAGLKNTVCAMAGGEAVISVELGDLIDPAACARHDAATQALLGWLTRMHGSGPVAVAHDLHPDFHSTRRAQELAARWRVVTVPVQHHHAHLAAVWAEQATLDRPLDLVGLALDGMGYGSDGSAWGGERLRLQGAACTRMGHLAPLPQPGGGDAVAREPWRLGAAVLYRLHSERAAASLAARWPGQPLAPQVARLLQHPERCPPTSSLGRVFDAAASLLGLCDVATHEAQAAITLEQAAAAHRAVHGPATALPGGWHIDAQGRLHLMPLLSHLAQSHVPGADPGPAAATFHATLGEALANWLQQAAPPHPEPLTPTTVALAGGCLHNALLRADLRQRLTANGLHLLEPQRLSPGDAAIALGQATVARGLLHNR